MPHIENVTLGSDVEFFVADPKGKIVTAERKVRGSKFKPFRFDPDNHYFATQLDNVLAEGNIPPAKTADEFAGYLLRLRGYLDETLTPFRTVAVASHVMSKSQIRSKHARTFGCDPSLDAWTGRPAPTPNPDNPALRSAGFHIHVGHRKIDEGLHRVLIQVMDLTLGLPAVLIEPPNDRKRVGYGLAGNYRNQPHGAEYRTLSSYFASTPELIKWAFDNTMLAIEMVNNGFRVPKSLPLAEVINNEQILAAESILEQFSIPLPNAPLLAAA